MFSEQQAQHRWSGWATISAEQHPGFTLWFTGLPGTGKTTLATLVRQALMTRGYHVEVIDTRTLSHWLNREMHLDEELREDRSHTPGYDAFVTYICTFLARNGIISIATSVSPYVEARAFAREQIQHFIEIYVFCEEELRQRRLVEEEHTTAILPDLYQPPQAAELHLDTSGEHSERSALRILNYLEEHGYITPRWAENDFDDDEITTIKARLQALGYLD